MRRKSSEKSKATLTHTIVKLEAEKTLQEGVFFEDTDIKIRNDSQERNGVLQLSDDIASVQGDYNPF